MKMPTQTELKALQVKAELSKLPEPPRAYLDKIILNDEEMIEGSLVSH